MYNLQIECPSIQCVSVELICKPDGSGMGPSGLQICKSDTFHPVYKFANRMDPPHWPSSLKLT